jgi:hypothetical protein
MDRGGADEHELRGVGPDGELRVAARTVQVFWSIGTGRRACFVPPIWLDCLARWRKGEFACLQA